MAKKNLNEFTIEGQKFRDYTDEEKAKLKKQVGNALLTGGIISKVATNVDATRKIASQEYKKKKSIPID